MTTLFVLLLGVVAFVEILEPPATAPTPATWTGTGNVGTDGTFPNPGPVEETWETWGQTERFLILDRWASRSNCSFEQSYSVTS